MPPELAAEIVKKTTSSNAYDSVPYDIRAFPQTRPDHLAVVARLFGLSSPHPARCRVLELGCAGGGNIISMALAHPQSEFVGVDLSEKQISAGQRSIQELSLNNISLVRRDIRNIDSRDGTFDYIIAHGVFSWVPADVQSHVLRVCREHLSPRGVAYVSYNTYPGWHFWMTVRDMMLYGTSEEQHPRDRVKRARNAVDFLASHALNREGTYCRSLGDMAASLRNDTDAYILHDHMEHYNQPLYFHQFVQRATEKGLQYLGEAAISSMMVNHFPLQTEQALRAISPDVVRLEQNMDFLRNRAFRQTLLCHGEVLLDRRLKSQVVKHFWITLSTEPAPFTANIESDDVAEFRCGPAYLRMRDPLLKAALRQLANIWPQAISFADLLSMSRQIANRLQSPAEKDADDLANMLLKCFTMAMVDLSLTSLRLITAISEKPTACAYARLLARDSTKVINTRSEIVVLTRLACRLLQLLDGARDTNALAAVLMKEFAKESFEAELKPGSINGGSIENMTHPEMAASYVKKCTQYFAKHALLVPISTPERFSNGAGD